MVNLIVHIISESIIARFDELMDLVECIKAMFRKVRASHSLFAVLVMLCFN